MERNNGRLGQVLFGVLLLCVVAYYGAVHWRVIGLEGPVTAREAAIVVDVEGYLSDEAPRPYTLESVPAYTNLYGMGYVWAAAPFVRWLPFSSFTSLRIANAFYLGLLLGALWLGAKGAPFASRLFGVALVYALFVSSPSIAASTDILGCFLYTLAWVAAVRTDFRIGPLLVTIGLGFLAFLTKPYFVLIIVSIGSYVFLFRSKKLGLIYAAMAGLWFTAGLWWIHTVYPYYLTSVIGPGKTFATIFWAPGVVQWPEFFVLALVPCFVCALSAGRWLKTRARLVKLSSKFDQPLLTGLDTLAPHGWGTLVAIGALAVSLSWNGGAYLIYFWHLLLPLLTLWFLKEATSRPLALCLNLTILLLLSPPLPVDRDRIAYAVLRDFVKAHPRVYLDPMFGSMFGNKRNLDEANSQGEYLLMFGRESHDPLLRERCAARIKAVADNFSAQSPDGLVMVESLNPYWGFSKFWEETYDLKMRIPLYPYYAPFRSRLNFGKATFVVACYEPKKKKAAEGAQPPTNELDNANFLPRRSAPTGAAGNALETCWKKRPF